LIKVDRNEPYRILGLDADADGSEVKAAFRYLSKKYHPDSSGDPSTTLRFMRVMKAYKTLDVELGKERLISNRVRARVLGESREDDMFSLGCLALTAPEAAGRRRAIRKLGFSGKKAAYVFLRRALGDRDETVVATAVRAVADLSAFQASSEMAALWARAGTTVRNAVMDAAEATGEPLFRQTLELAAGETGSHAVRARRLLSEAGIVKNRGA